MQNIREKKTFKKLRALRYRIKYLLSDKILHSAFVDAGKYNVQKMVILMPAKRSEENSKASDSKLMKEGIT